MPDEEHPDKRKHWMIWYLIRCSANDDVSLSTAWARWSLGFGLLGVFCVIFGTFAIKVSYDSVAASYGLHWEAALILIIGGSLLGLGGLLFAVLALCYCCTRNNSDNQNSNESDDEDEEEKIPTSHVRTSITMETKETLKPQISENHVHSNITIETKEVPMVYISEHHVPSNISMETKEVLEFPLGENYSHYDSNVAMETQDTRI